MIERSPGEHQFIIDRLRSSGEPGVAVKIEDGYSIETFHKLLNQPIIVRIKGDEICLINIKMLDQAK